MTRELAWCLDNHFGLLQRNRDMVTATRDTIIVTSDATPAIQTTLTEEDRTVSDGLRLRTLACVGSANKHDLESKTCAKMCAKARTTAPR